MFVVACCATNATVWADPEPAPAPVPAPVHGPAQAADSQGAAPGPPQAPPPPPPSPAPAPGSPAPPAPKTVIDQDGTYAVGTDIVPGTYVSDGPAGGIACYWKRVSGDQIVDNSLSKKPQVAKIAPTDTSFKTDHCQPWHRVDCLENCPTPEQQPMPALPPGLFPGFPNPLPQEPGPAAGE